MLCTINFSFSLILLLLFIVHLSQGSPPLPSSFLLSSPLRLFLLYLPFHLLLLLLLLFLLFLQICQELIVNAVTLECTHAFCSVCASAWLAKNKICPNCRQSATKQPAKARHIDNIIEKIVNKLDQDVRPPSFFLSLSLVSPPFLILSLSSFLLSSFLLSSLLHILS